MCNRVAIGGKTHPKCIKALGMEGLLSLYAYTEIMRKAIKKLKFRFVTDMLNEFGEIVMQGMAKYVWVREFLKNEKFVVVGVPLHGSRERWRGFNQAQEIGKRLAKGLELEFGEGVLERTKNTDSQSELKVKLDRETEKELKEKAVSKEDFEMMVKNELKKDREKKRKENVRNAFGLRNKKQETSYKLQNKNILLVDDVWTSGATMRECGKVLKRAGVGKVWGFTVAR